jgi:hypothetical protein
MICDRTLVLSPKLLGIGVDAYLAARNCEPRIIVKTIFEAVSNPDETVAAVRVSEHMITAGVQVLDQLRRKTPIVTLVTDIYRVMSLAEADLSNGGPRN